MQNYTTTIYTENGFSKMRVALCMIHRHNRVFAGDVYGARKLKSDGRWTTKPCYDCGRKAQQS